VYTVVLSRIYEHQGLDCKGRERAVGNTVAIGAHEGFAALSYQQMTPATQDPKSRKPIANTLTSNLHIYVTSALCIKAQVLKLAMLNLRKRDILRKLSVPRSATLVDELSVLYSL